VKFGHRAPGLSVEVQGEGNCLCFSTSERCFLDLPWNRSRRCSDADPIGADDCRRDLDRDGRRDDALLEQERQVVEEFDLREANERARV
jgi:hypothetical protein